jgi:4-amino-4-deoxy-L-arabinose transferase-like glycosyltransferase
MDDAFSVTSHCFLSLILPAYNEEAVIAQAVAEADEALRQFGVVYEIVVVDDGSQDQTATIVQQIMCDRPCVRLIRHDGNRGYGAALRTGFEAARGGRIAFTDADCQFHLADLALLIPLTEQHPVAVGYRVDRQDPWLRKFYSRGYNVLVQILLGTSVRDIDCALKIFRREALAIILPQTSGFLANTEMLTKARQHRLSIAEVGVRHRPRQRGVSKVSPRDIPRTLNALLPFWWMKVMFPASSEAEARARESPNPSLAFRAQSAPMQALLMGLLFAMTCVLFFARLDHPLLEPEEARYAEIPREMMLEGRVLTPVLHHEDYWQKPPLLYWLVMLSYQLFGVHDWAARLVPCFAGIICVAITTLWAWRTLGYWSGLVSGMILTLSVRFLYLAGMLSMDSLLCTFVLAGLAFGHLALTEAQNRKRWIVLSALACALGILTKGPVALILTAAPLVALAFFDRRCRFLTKIESCVYLGIVALVAGPWFVVMAASAPQAAGAFLWLHHLVRYFAPIDHEKPAWFFLPSLLLGMMPWTLLLIPMIPYFCGRSLQAGKRRPAALGAFMLAFGWCVVFFSLSGCKRQGYVLPALPLLALIVGAFVTHGLPWRRWMQAASGRRVRAHQLSHRWARGLTLATFVMGSIISVAAALSRLWSWPDAPIPFLVFVALGVAVAAAPARAPAWTSWAGCAVAVFLVLSFGQRTWVPDYHQRFGLRRQIEISSEYEQEELPILTYPKRWDSIGFYSKRTNVESYGPADFAQLMHDLHKHGKALIFVKREEALRDLLNALPDHLEVEMLGQDVDYVAVGIVRRRKK